MSADTSNRLELARLLARFKLNIKRHLDVSIDLNRLQEDPDYARKHFSLLEDQIQDEDLLVMLLDLRDRLLPKSPALVAEAAGSRYRFGPRG